MVRDGRDRWETDWFVFRVVDGGRFQEKLLRQRILGLGFLFDVDVDRRFSFPMCSSLRLLGVNVFVESKVPNDAVHMLFLYFL